MERFEEIEISKIKSLENVRTNIKEKEVHELMQSINQQGLLEPIGVYESEGGYVIAYGNRRLIACEKLGWKKITARIVGELTYEDMLIMNTSENIHRKEVTVAEVGRICELLSEAGLSESEMSIRLGLSSSMVKTALHSYKRIPTEFRKDIVFMKAGQRNKMGKIPASIFNTLITINREFRLGKKEFFDLIKTIKKNDMSSSQIRTLASMLKVGMNLDEALKELDNYIIRRINLPVKKKTEESLLEKHELKGADKVSKLFRKILRGEISGEKSLVY